jgi:hypothetical protein
MTWSQFSTDSLNVPQPILDHYNAHHDNMTYRAFTDALAACLNKGTADPIYSQIANLLIDAAFERSGAEIYRGAAVQLGALLMDYQNPELFALAEQHLRRFNQAADEILLTAGLLHTLEVLRALAESAVRAASDHHGWRGRMAFWWLNAIAAIAQAAYAVLEGSHSSYVQEKLTAAARSLRDGVSEGAAAGFVMAYPVMTWFTHFPLR